MADDCFSNTERMDGTQGRRRETGGKYVESAPSAHYRFRLKARPFENPGRLDEELQARRTFRCKRQTDPGTGRSRAEGRPQDGCESKCEWRPVAQGSRDTRFPRLCRDRKSV